MKDKKVIGQENKKSVLGIDISDKSIEICEVSHRNGVIEIESASRMEFDSGIVDKGIIKDTARFQKTFQKALAKAYPKSFEAKDVVVSIPESAVYILSEEVRNDLKGVQLEEFIDQKAKALVGEDIEESIKIYQSISIGKKKQRVVIGLTNKKNVNTIVKEMSLAKFNVIGIEPESAATARSVVRDFHLQAAIMFIDLGENSTIVSVFDANGLNLSTTLPIAGNAITDAIAKALRVGKKEAENIKTQYGIAENKYSKQINNAVTMLLDRIVREVKDSIEFYKDTIGRDIDTIKICGGTARLKGLVDYFKSNIKNINIEIADTWVDYSNIETMKISYYLDSIGLALKGLNLNRDLDDWNFAKSVQGLEDTKQTNRSSILKIIKGLFAKREKPSDAKVKKHEVDKNEKKVEVKTNEEVSSMAYENGLSISNDIKSKGFQTNEQKKVVRSKIEKKDIGNKNKIKIKKEGSDYEGVVLGNIPNGTKKYKILIITIAIILIVGSIGTIIYSLFFRETNTSSTSSPVNYLNSSKEVFLNIEDTVSNDLDFDLIEKEIEVEDTFEATGEGFVGEYVRGEVEIVNNTNTTYPVVASTRLITGDGRLYRLDDQTTITAGSSTLAKITASDTGETFNLEEGTILTFPGLSAALNDDIFAQVKGSLTLEKETIVNEEDLEYARNELEAKVRNIRIDELKIEQNESTILVEEILNREIKGVSFNAGENEPLKSFTGTCSAILQVLSFKKSDLEMYISQTLKEDIEISDYYTELLSVKLKSYDEGTGIVTLEIVYRGAQK